MTSLNLLTIFTTGLLTGGLSCLAVQGGLLATTIAQQEEDKLKKKTLKTGNALPILSFLISKLIAYTIFGFLLGWLGSLVQLSLTVTVFMQLAASIVMIGTALNLLNVHPIFRYFVIQPPKFLFKLVRNQSKSKALFAPALLGALTVFIPCGTTQAMMVLAITSGNPFGGALILFTFVLGTSPLFFTLGYFATKLGDALHKKFMVVAAVALIFLGVYSLFGSLRLAGIDFGSAPQPTILQTATTEPTVTIGEIGYSPNTVAVAAGSTVKLHLVNQGGSGCIQAFTIPKLGIQRVIPVGQSDVITFQAPSEKGPLPFMCSMGMYRGVINVL